MLDKIFRGLLALKSTEVTEIEGTIVLRENDKKILS